MNNSLTIRHFSSKKNGACIALPRDTLAYHDITFCLSGKMEYEINDIPCTLYAGDAIYFAEGDTRKRIASDAPINYVSFNFFSSERQLPEGYYFKSLWTQKLNKATELFFDAYVQHQTEQCLALIRYILLEINSILTAQKENPRITEIKNYIYRNLENRITVEDIAQHVYLSKIYCETFFKKETGQTLIQFVNSEKIKSAQSLLLLGELTLTQVSETFAFCDYNYFARTFKKITGISPNKYVKLLK